MSVTPEELAAFADGELDPVRHAEIGRAVEADPDLARDVTAHRALRARLAAHYAPILDQPVPESLNAPLRCKDKVFSLTEHRKSRAVKRSVIPRWKWVAGPALAACLVLALIPLGSSPKDYAGQQIATALDDQLVATQPADAPVRVLLSFRDRSGAFCRAFTTAEQGGIACKDAQGWRLMEHLAGSTVQTEKYRQAGSVSDQLMARAQEVADGPALDATEEERAMAIRWKSSPSP